MGAMPTLAANAEGVKEVSETEVATYPVSGGSILFNPATGTVTGYEGAPTKIDIPDKINGVNIVAIGENAFASCYSLAEIIIPESVTTIEAYAFYDCYSLICITLPKSLKTIGVAAFACCGILTELIIPDGVTTIESYTFYECVGLPTIHLPASVTSVDIDAFDGCTILEGIWVDENNPNYSSDRKGVLFNKEQTELIRCPLGLEGSYTVPNSVTTIEEYAFYNCYSLTSITLPNSLKTIGNSAFEGCDSLSHIIIPNGVTTISEYAFYWCSGLERVDIPASVTTIGPEAFSRCFALEGIWVDENNPNYSSDKNGVLFNKNKTELIAYPNALSDSYNVPDGVATIGYAAFRECDNLTDISFPNSLTTIGDAAFWFCSGLTSITFPDGLTTIGEASFRGCEALTSIALPDSLTTIEDGAFRECYNLSAIAFPDHLEHIGWIAFEYCESLITLTIPDGVTTIEDWAFEFCHSLESVAIPASVTYLGGDVFYKCPNLSHIYYGGTQEQWEELSSYNDFSGITVHYNETAPWHDCASNDFADIPFFNNWAHDGIDYCVENKLMNGMGNNLFSPNGTVSRAQLVTILYRVAGSPKTEFAGTFTDVAEGLWYSDAIEWAAANGVVNGVGDGKFAPEQSITREQIATILYRYHGSPAVSGSLSGFPDAGSVRDYALNSMLWATQEGLINGVASNGITSLSPQTNATRAQIAAIIMRYCEHS